MTCRSVHLPLLGAALVAFAAPGLAQSAPPPPSSPPGAVVDAEGRVFGNTNYDPRPEWKGPQPVPAPPARPLGYEQPAAPHAAYDEAAWQRAREDWLAECRRNHKGGKGKVTGAIVGGLVGGVIGNQVAGKGDRTLGTVAGAAVGAVTGGAIGNQADNNRARDFCEAYLDRYTAQTSTYAPSTYAAPTGYAPAGYAYAYQPVMVMMPVMVATPPAPRRECVETTVITEWVEVAPGKPHKHRVTDKRVKLVPDKRVRAN